jgi:hypothetical protein
MFLFQSYLIAEISRPKGLLRQLACYSLTPSSPLCGCAGCTHIQRRRVSKSLRPTLEQLRDIPEENPGT